MKRKHQTPNTRLQRSTRLQTSRSGGVPASRDSKLGGNLFGVSSRRTPDQSLARLYSFRAGLLEQLRQIRFQILEHALRTRVGDQVFQLVRVSLQIIKFIHAVERR